MPRRAPSTHPQQLELFRPARIRPTWDALPKEARKTAIRLLIEILREHWRREQSARGAKGVTCE